MDHAQEAMRIRNAANEKIKAIQADQTLSDVGRGQQIAAVREKSNSDISALRTKQAEERAAKAASLRSHLFSPDYRISATEVEKITATQSYRDALFRADSLDTPDKALRLLQRARDVGDDLLARATAFVAYERQWPGVVDAFVSSSESMAQSLTELRMLEGSSASERFQRSAAFTGIPETKEERSARIADHHGSQTFSAA